MEILEAHHIAIDTYTVLHPADTTFLLSHVHTDHAHIPKSFQYSVYASIMTPSFLHPQIRPVLSPGQWYSLAQIPIQILKTHHTFDSIGF